MDLKGLHPTLNLHASYAATLIVDSKILSQLVNSQFVYTVIASHGKGFLQMLMEPPA